MAIRVIILGHFKMLLASREPERALGEARRASPYQQPLGRVAFATICREVMAAPRLFDLRPFISEQEKNIPICFSLAGHLKNYPRYTHKIIDDASFRRIKESKSSSTKRRRNSSNTLTCSRKWLPERSRL